jgi:hypothetical protein
MTKPYTPQIGIDETLIFNHESTRIDTNVDVLIGGWR